MQLHNAQEWDFPPVSLLSPYFQAPSGYIWAILSQSSYLITPVFLFHQTSSSFSDLNSPQLTLFMSCMTEVSIFSGLCTYKGLKHFDDTSREIQLEGSAWRGKNSDKPSERDKWTQVLWRKISYSIKAGRTKKPEVKICFIGLTEDKVHLIFRKCCTPSSLPSFLLLQARCSKAPRQSPSAYLLGQHKVKSSCRKLRKTQNSWTNKPRHYPVQGGFSNGRSHQVHETHC